MAENDADVFMENFGDALVDEDNSWQTNVERGAADTLDASLQAPNANDFSNARLIEEVRHVSFISGRASTTRQTSVVPEQRHVHGHSRPKHDSSNTMNNPYTRRALFTLQSSRTGIQESAASEIRMS